MNRPCSNTCFNDHCFSFFFQAGQGKKGPDKAVFVEILTSRNFAQLRATLDAYKTVSMEDYLCANHLVLWSSRVNFHSPDMYSSCILNIVLYNSPSYSRILIGSRL